MVKKEKVWIQALLRNLWRRANSDMTVTKLKILISNVRANTRTEGAGHIDSKDFNGP